MVNMRSLENCSTILLRRREGGEGVSNWESAGGCSSFRWKLADPSSVSRDQKAALVAQPSVSTKRDFCERETLATPSYERQALGRVVERNLDILGMCLAYSS